MTILITALVLAAPGPAALAVARLVPAALAAPSPGPTPGPTLAVEDTLRTEVPEVLVRAPRVTLDEILGRVARGEARRESLLVDQTFTAAVRILRDVKGAREPRLVEESVWRVYRKRPEKVRSILLRRWREERPRGRMRTEMRVEFSPGMGEEIVHFAFRPEARREYRYRIVGRDLVGDHVIYQVAFEPRSVLQAFPARGVVWIDTNDFVIVREEVGFARSPVPLILKSVDRMVVERQRVGGHWVLGRVLVRAEATVPMPMLGKSFDLAIHYRDYEMNRGLDDTLFPGGGKR